MIDLEFGPARLSLLPGRAMYWAEQRALLVADTHFGKASVFRSQGLAVPEGDTEQDMQRISDLAHQWRATRIIILGDVVHGAVDSSLDRQLRRWIADLSGAGVEVVLVAGNHDRALADQSRRWGASIVACMRLGGLLLTHDAPEQASEWVLGGHIHPVLSLGGRGPDRLRMPVFWQRQRRLVLPAFGQFTGGYRITPGRHDRIWLAGPDAVMAFDSDG